MTKRYLVTVHGVGNVTNNANNIHTILTSGDHISPRNRVEVVEFSEDTDFGPEHKHKEGDVAILVRSKIPTGHGGDLGAGLQVTRKDLDARNPVKIIDHRHDNAGQLLYGVDFKGVEIVVMEGWLE